jgi:hypothetical protein
VQPINKVSRAKPARRRRIYVQGLRSELHHPDLAKEKPSSDPRVFLCRSVTEPARRSALDARTGATLPDRLTIRRSTINTRVRLLSHLTQRPHFR